MASMAIVPPPRQRTVQSTCPMHPRRRPPDHGLGGCSRTLISGGCSLTLISMSMRVLPHSLISVSTCLVRRQSDMHWFDIADEAAHEDSIRALAKGGYDEVLAAIGEYLGLDHLVTFSIGLLAVTKADKGVSSLAHHALHGILIPYRFDFDFDRTNHVTRFVLIPVVAVRSHRLRELGKTRLQPPHQPRDAERRARADRGRGGHDGKLPSRPGQVRPDLRGAQRRRRHARHERVSGIPSLFVAGARVRVSSCTLSRAHLDHTMYRPSLPKGAIIRLPAAFASPPPYSSPT